MIIQTAKRIIRSIFWLVPVFKEMVRCQYQEDDADENPCEAAFAIGLACPAIAAALTCYFWNTHYCWYFPIGGFLTYLGAGTVQHHILKKEHRSGLY